MEKNQLGTIKLLKKRARGRPSHEKTKARVWLSQLNQIVDLPPCHCPHTLAFQILVQPTYKISIVFVPHISWHLHFSLSIFVFSKQIIQHNKTKELNRKGGGGVAFSKR